MATELKNNQVFRRETQNLKQHVSRCDVCLVFVFIIATDEPVKFGAETLTTMYVTLTYTQRIASVFGERSTTFVLYKFMKDYRQKRVTKFYIRSLMPPVSQVIMIEPIRKTA